MSPQTVDEIGTKILRILLRDARTSLKTIAKECDLSEVAVLNRIRRLKADGIIVRTTLRVNMEKFGYTHAASVGINIDEGFQTSEILEAFKKQPNIGSITQCYGKYDMFAFIQARSVGELDEAIRIIKKHPRVTRAEISLFVREPEILYENFDFSSQEKDGDANGRD